MADASGILLKTRGDSIKGTFRRFVLVRHRDDTGISGIGTVAEGVLFSSGKCVISWTTKVPSVTIYDSIEEVTAIHGHEGDTELKWKDT